MRVQILLIENFPSLAIIVLKGVNFDIIPLIKMILISIFRVPDMMV